MASNVALASMPTVAKDHARFEMAWARKENQDKTGQVVKWMMQTTGVVWAVTGGDKRHAPKSGD